MTEPRTIADRDGAGPRTNPPDDFNTFLKLAIDKLAAGDVQAALAAAREACHSAPKEPPHLLDGGIGADPEKSLDEACLTTPPGLSPPPCTTSSPKALAVLPESVGNVDATG
jgi:hypothetical protein